MLEFRVKCKYSIESGWTCSGGSQTSKDTCLEICGDDIRFSINNTYCDDGDNKNGDGCSSTCSIESGWICSGGSKTIRDLCKEICGDGIKFNTISTYCDEICQIETGWVCTFGSPCTVICGDGIIIINKEDCDDKSTTPNNGCSSDCKTENGYNCAPVSPDTFQLKLQFVETD